MTNRIASTMQYMIQYRLTCVCRPTLCMVASNYVPRRLGLCWSRVPGLLPVSAASPSMDHEHGTVCQPILEHQIRPSAPSSVISRPTCFSSSLRCCWQVGSASFVRRRCGCLASSAPFTNIQTYLLTSGINLHLKVKRCRCNRPSEFFYRFSAFLSPNHESEQWRQNLILWYAYFNYMCILSCSLHVQLHQVYHLEFFTIPY